MNNCIRILSQINDREIKTSFDTFTSLKIINKMFNLNATIIIVVNFLRLVHAPDPVTSSNSSTENNPSDETLIEIQSNEVLPLVLFPSDVRFTKKPILELAENLVNPVIINGRIVEGTQFSTRTSNEQIFFCPKQDSDEKCLQPRKFEKSEPLQCAKEAITVTKENVQPRSCGWDRTNLGNIYNIGYEICQEEELLKYKNKKMDFYTICYDKTNEKTIYTYHQLRASNTLRSKQLEQERRVTYSLIFNDKFLPKTLDGINTASNLNFKLLAHPTNPAYKIQQLIPDEDMSFALWRKTTYENFNFDWQHEKLIPLWNKINDRVRLYATKMFDDKFNIYIHTKISEAVSPPKNDGQVYNMWIKMITALPSNLRGSGDPEGIVILMNNFLDDTIPNAREALKEFCVEDLCEESLKNEFIEIGAGVRCCDLSIGKIRLLFGVMLTYPNYLAMKIPGVISKEIPS